MATSPISQESIIRDLQIFRSCFESITPNFRTSITLPNDVVQVAQVVSSCILKLLQGSITPTSIRDFIGNENYLNAVGLLVRKETRREYYCEPLVEQICLISKNLEFRGDLFSNNYVLLGMSEVARAFTEGIYSLRDIEKYFAVNVIEENQLKFAGKSLGKGATATVVLADLQTQTGGWFSFFRSRPSVQVAVKVSRQDFNFNEVFISSAIQHSSFLKFYGYSIKQQDGADELLIVMEYAQHGSLKEFVMKNNTRINPNLKKKFLVDFFGGLSFLHNLEIFHRDIKADNCMIVEREQGLLCCCITDLGSARATSSNASIVARSVAGTALYQAPEILVIEEDITLQINTQDNGDNTPQINFKKQSDIYPSGYIIYTVSESKIPYSGLAKQQLATTKQSDLSLKVDMPQRIEISPSNPCIQLMRGCWKFNLNERLTATQILEQLKNIQF
eukprot:TRINITY_DN90_c0_g1_i2.p1 TRINITY_DN90_c0_g1~~TRINITY_DN90_c0_g1_i2.p1  ORF type:complete len:447 (-),score=157.62 TRINITY_DN90_c0_g1_i2:266-1606(-)